MVDSLFKNGDQSLGGKDKIIKLQTKTTIKTKQLFEKGENEEKRIIWRNNELQKQKIKLRDEKNQEKRYNHERKEIRRTTILVKRTSNGKSDLKSTSSSCFEDRITKIWYKFQNCYPNIPKVTTFMHRKIVLTIFLTFGNMFYSL